MKKCQENGKTPEWMTKWRTFLIIKDEKKGNKKFYADYMPSYDVECFNKNTGRAVLWTYGKGENVAEQTEGLQKTE